MEMITLTDLPNLLGVQSYGFIIGIFIGAFSFILTSIINTFFGIAR